MKRLLIPMPLVIIWVGCYFGQFVTWKTKGFAELVCKLARMKNQINEKAKQEIDLEQLAIILISDQL